MAIWKDSLRKLLYALETQSLGAFGTTKLALSLLFQSSSKQ